jgi:hypothetical protein
MEVINNGDLVGLAFKGVSGFLILLYLIMEIGFIYHTRMTFLQMILLNIRLNSRIQKSIPPWWKVHKSNQLCSINRPFLKYRVWVELRLKENQELKGDLAYSNKYNGWVYLDRIGRFENDDEINELLQSSKIPEDIRKKYQREKLLNDLNI